MSCCTSKLIYWSKFINKKREDPKSLSMGQKNLWNKNNSTAIFLSYSLERNKIIKRPSEIMNLKTFGSTQQVRFKSQLVVQVTFQVHSIGKVQTSTCSVCNVLGPLNRQASNPNNCNVGHVVSFRIKFVFIFF